MPYHNYNLQIIQSTCLHLHSPLMIHIVVQEVALEWLILLVQVLWIEVKKEETSYLIPEYLRFLAMNFLTVCLRLSINFTLFLLRSYRNKNDELSMDVNLGHNNTLVIVVKPQCTNIYWIKVSYIITIYSQQ
jgi:hypothetical protein